MNKEELVAYSDFIVAFDTEYVWNNELQRQDFLEIAAIRVARGETVGVFQTLVKPASLDINVPMLNKSHISMEMVANAVSQEEAVSQFLAFAGNATLVAHQIRSDLSVLSSFADVSNLAACTKAMAEVTGLTAESGSLEDVYKACLSRGAKPGVFEGVAHRALPDASMVASVYEFLKPKILELYDSAAIDKHPIVDPVVFADQFKRSSSTPSYFNHKSVSKIEVNPSSIDKSNPFFDRCITSTNCSSEENQALSEIIAKLGGHWTNAVRKRDQTILIVDNATYDKCKLNSSAATGNMKSAIKWELEMMPVREFVLEANKYLGK